MRTLPLNKIIWYFYLEEIVSKLLLLSERPLVVQCCRTVNLHWLLHFTGLMLLYKETEDLSFSVCTLSPTRLITSPTLTLEI